MLNYFKYGILFVFIIEIHPVWFYDRQYYNISRSNRKM